MRTIEALVVQVLLRRIDYIDHGDGTSSHRRSVTMPEGGWRENPIPVR